MFCTRHRCGRFCVPQPIRAAMPSLMRPKGRIAAGGQSPLRRLRRRFSAKTSNLALGALCNQLNGRARSHSDRKPDRAPAGPLGLRKSHLGWGAQKECEDIPARMARAKQTSNRKRPPCTKHKTGVLWTLKDYFLSASRISISRSISLGPAGVSSSAAFSNFAWALVA